jgi:hypothetical protein
VRELWNTRPREAALEARVKELGQNITAASNQFWAEQKRLVAALAQRGAAVEKLLDSFDYMNSNCRDCPFENPCCQYGNGEDCCRAAAERWAYLPAPSPEDAA